jgi:hypothetical protein
MRLIEIRGQVHDVDALVRRGRALHGAAVRRLIAAVIAAGGRALRRRLARPFRGRGLRPDPRGCEVTPCGAAAFAGCKAVSRAQP